MNVETRVQEIKEREIIAFNYRGKVRITERTTAPCFSGRMNLLTRADIEISYDPKYVEESKDLEEIVEDPFEEACTALMRHELNHKGGNDFKGCPRDIDLHVEGILEPVAETLSSLGFTDVPINDHQGLYAYFANLVEDFIDNFELGTKTKTTGMFLLYKDGAEHLENKKFPPLFDAFVELQERVYAGKRAKRLIKPHHSGEKKVHETVENFLTKSGLAKLKRKVVTRRKKQEVEIFNKKLAANYCLDETNWAALSKTLTEEFATLIDKTQMTKPSYIKKMFLPLKGESDAFDDEMKDKETRMKFAFKKYQRPGASFEPPKYLDRCEALDLVYQRLARNLEIITRVSTKSEAMPVMWFGRRPFDQTSDRLSRARVGISGEGKLELRVRKHHEDEPIEYTEGKGNIPKIKFVLLDTSSSMQLPTQSTNSGKIMNPWAESGMQWNDNSRYHHALLGWYGLLEFIRKQGTLKHTTVKFANYSGETYTATNLIDAKRLALSPQFGGTTLDLSKVRNMFGEKQLIFSLSDGNIENWNTIKDEYIRRAKRNEYFHLQIGNATQMSQDLEAAGLRVIFDDGTHIGKIIIDLTRPYVSRSKK